MKIENLQPQKWYKIVDNSNDYENIALEFIEEKNGSYYFFLYVSIDCKGIFEYDKTMIDNLEEIII